MLAWSQNKLPNLQGESWADFESRVIQAFSSLKSDSANETVWLVSSGGVIAMLLKHVLSVSNEKMIDLNLQIRNSSMTDIFCNKEQISLSAFNQIPHLEYEGRLNAVTYA